jgi:hypothetical protein
MSARYGAVKRFMSEPRQTHNSKVSKQGQHRDRRRQCKEGGNTGTIRGKLVDFMKTLVDSC